MATPRLLLQLVPTLILVLLLGSVAAACSTEEEGALSVAEDENVDPDYEYTIPPGWAERIQNGEDVLILPAELTVTVGEVIRIVNEDSAGHSVGIFYVGAGEVVTQRFASPGEYIGSCTAHPSGLFTLVVER